MKTNLTIFGKMLIISMTIKKVLFIQFSSTTLSSFLFKMHNIDSHECSKEMAVDGKGCVMIIWN